jgi:capsular exopolysaccharide synthesis family protein
LSGEILPKILSNEKRWNVFDSAARIFTTAAIKQRIKMNNKDRLHNGEDARTPSPLSGYAKPSEFSQARSVHEFRSSNGTEIGNVADISGRMIPELSREQHKLSNTVLLAQERQGVRSVLVTGTGEGVGVTSVAATLALGLSADPRKRVLLIDINNRKPKLHKLFDLTNSSDLTVASGDPTGFLDMAAVNGISNLRVITANGALHGASFDAKRFVAVLPALKEAFDFMIVDAPPVNLNFDALMLSLHLDSVMLVAEAGRTRFEEVREILKELQRAGANTLGIVLNRQREDLPAALQNLL